MSKKINCWEYMKCGRELNGGKVNELGICPAATYTSADGINGGVNGGRMCWAIVGIYASYKNKDSFPQKNPFCFYCKFHRKVLSEEGLIKLKALKPK